MDDLTEPEQRVWDAFPESRPTDLAGEPVRADVLAALALGVRPGLPGRTPAVRLFNARVTGLLDLSLATVPHTLVLVGCEFERAPVLDGARLPALTLVRARLPGLQAVGARIDGPLSLLECHCSGPLRLDGADVAGVLDLNGAELRGDPAIRADYLTVGRDLALRNAVVEGKVGLWNAHIRQTIALDGARLSSPGGVAFDGDGMTAEDGLFARRLESSGEFRLRDARLGRRCDLTDARLASPGRTALDAEALKLDGTLDMSRLTAEGSVNVSTAAITGALILDGATLRKPEGTALAAGLITVTAIRAVRGFTATGRVDVGGARISGSLVLDGAHISKPGGTALRAVDADIGGTLYLTSGFRAEGEVDLAGVSVRDGVDLGGARLVNPGKAALSASNLRTVREVHCCGGFRASGRVSFTSAEIGRDLCFDDANIDGDLELKRARSGILRLGERTKLLGKVDLRHASTDVLADFRDAWPATVRLDGFTYKSLHRPMPVADRLQLLASDADGYVPQPYEHLAAVYRATGHDGAARDVLLAKQRRRRGVQQFPQRAWGFLQDWTVGYGYRPQWAAAWLIALLALGTAVFAGHHPPPLKKDEAPAFNPFLYALDLLLPIVGFGQESAFAPRGAYQWLAAALTAAGWVLASTIIAGTSRVLARQ
ncbi:hypothetical protein DZF91_02765 [Actinomadura logoneensis]|uniref:Oxidoreductase n=1 Tax=Actinomadura logoneensis TaxID=2293572 RepID=A0A372JTQ0_9ACTN|nr:hypothetical protein [Actinomadura logoneensis]RFU43134.1 hypothetical protein DZF91_02765 [Actinomadura logoneensis]